MGSFCRNRPDPGVPLRPFTGASCECFSPDSPVLRPLQRLGVGDERRWRRRDDPHAHCVQPRRTLPEPNRVAEFGALEEAREMCMVSPELALTLVPECERGQDSLKD